MSRGKRERVGEGEGSRPGTKLKHDQKGERCERAEGGPAARTTSQIAHHPAECCGQIGNGKTEAESAAAVVDAQKGASGIKWPRRRPRGRRAGSREQNCIVGHATGAKRMKRKHASRWGKAQRKLRKTEQYVV